MCGSTKTHQVNGKNVLGRKTRWGIVEVENENHCEFSQLRDMIIRFVVAVVVCSELSENLFFSLKC